MPKSSSGGKKRPAPAAARKARKPSATSTRRKPRSVPVPKLSAVSTKQASWYKRFNYERWRTARRETNRGRKRLPSSWALGLRAARLIWSGRGLLSGVIIIYGLIDLLFGQGLVNRSDVSSLKDAIDSLVHGHASGIATSFGHFALLASSSSNTSNDSSGAYQFVLVIVVSLALIYALRQITAKVKTRVRDTFYKGMYPFIPFILITLVLIVQLIPLLIGAGAYYLVMYSGIAVGGFEKTIWVIIFILLSLLSLYMLSSSLFGLYIVSLPDMTPMKALRSARQISRYRHWLLFRKILFLPLALLIIFCVIMAPVILFATALTQWLYFLLSIFSLVLIHGYLYTLYRELLSE